MGRLSAPGPLPALLLALLSLLPGCHRGEGQDVDPTRAFAARGEAVVRTLGIYAGGDRVGTITRTLSEGEWPGLAVGTSLLLSERVEMDVLFQDSLFTISTESRAVLAREDLTLRAARVASSFGVGQEPMAVTYERLDRGLLLKTEHAGGASQSEPVTLPPGMLTLEALPFLLSRQPEGKPFPPSLDLYSLSLRRPLRVEVSPGKREGDLRRFEVTLLGMAESVWLDAAGMAVRETMPWDLVARPPDPGGGEPVRPLDLQTLLVDASIPVQDVPYDLRDAVQVTCLLEGIPQPPPGDRWQEVRPVRQGAELTLHRPVVPPPERQLPRGIPSREPVLNPGDPALASLALRVTGNAPTPWDKAVAAGKWVFANLGKTLRECTSASDAIRAGEGECQAHAVVAAALCQAVSIPTRFVSGVVYLPERRAYFFHGWLEADVGEWIPLDPTLGRFPAGVDHIVLARGAFFDQLQVAPFLFLDRPWRVVFPPPVSRKPTR